MINISKMSISKKLNISYAICMVSALVVCVFMFISFIDGAVKPCCSGRGYEARFWYQDRCCSIYCLMISNGAPPQEAAKYEGLHSMFFQYLFSMSGRCFLRSLEETPLRLFTRVEMATFGGYSTSRCT